jgi:hypothetical protein
MDARLCLKITDCWETKRAQLNASVAEFSATGRALILVINRQIFTGAFNARTFPRLLQQVHADLGLDNTSHLAIVTGLIDATTGQLDDCVFPTW